MKDEKKEKDSFPEFVEEIIEDIPIKKSENRKLNTKLILGKKTILKKKKLLSPQSQPQPPTPTPIPQSQKIEKKSNAEFLVESIVKTYWVSKWKEQLLIMKYSKQGFNKKRGTFRSFCMKMNNAMKYHQYLYLAKLFDKMEALPKKENIKHDKNFGKLILVKNNSNISEDLKIENEINNEIEININLPEIQEVEYKPENEEENIDIKINENINENKEKMEIENNYEDKK